MMGRMIRWTFLGPALALAGVLAGMLLHFFVAHGGMLVGAPFPPGQRINLLIMGLDRTVSDQNPNVVLPVSRTDTLIAASFDSASRRVYVLSIPRDTQTVIPGHGLDKINAAHAHGGAALTLRTVENFMGVHFPYYIEINARGLTHLIDAVGGINIYVDKDMNYDDNWDGLHIHLRKGYRRLGGKAAMEYVRFRHDTQGDISRVDRQQRFVNALIDELRRPRVLLRASRILRVFREDVTTNLPPDQVFTLAWFATRLPRQGLLRATLPGEFGSEDWIPDVAKDRDLIVRAFLDTDPDSLAKATIDIVNGAGVHDALIDPLARLTALGVQIVRVTEATDASETVLVVHHGDPRVGSIVAAAVDARLVIEPTAGRGPDLTLILAKGYPAGIAHTAVR